MWKKLFSLVITIAIMLSVFSVTTLAAGMTIKLDGKNLTTDVAPFIDANGRTMVPVRLISEGLGASVAWDAKSRLITITKSTTVIKLTIGSKQITTNGQASTMDTAAVIASGSTYVPVRFIAEALNLTAGWDGPTGTVLLTSSSSSASPSTTTPPPTTTPPTTSSDTILARAGQDDLLLVLTDPNSAEYKAFAGLSTQSYVVDPGGDTILVVPVKNNTTIAIYDVVYNEDIEDFVIKKTLREFVGKTGEPIKVTAFLSEGIPSHMISGELGNMWATWLFAYDGEGTRGVQFVSAIYPEGYYN